MPVAVVPSRILVIDDDAIVREIVVAYMRGEGEAIVEAADAASALAAMRAAPCDLAIVDFNLPDGSGLELAEQLRRVRDCAVIFMTSRGSADDRVRGLASGDDYIVKPIEVRELLARVQAVLRRYRRSAAGGGIDSVINLAGWTLDFVRRELADAQGSVVRLTRAEFDLFAALVQARGVPLSREYLVEVVASADAATQPRTIDVMVSRIRRKLAVGSRSAPRIMTSPGQGYRFEATP